MLLDDLAQLPARRLRDLSMRTIRAYLSHFHVPTHNDGAVVVLHTDDDGGIRFRWPWHDHRKLCDSMGKDLDCGAGRGDSTGVRISVLHHVHARKNSSAGVCACCVSIQNRMGANGSRLGNCKGCCLILKNIESYGLGGFRSDSFVALHEQRALCRVKVLSLRGM